MSRGVVLERPDGIQRLPAGRVLLLDPVQPLVLGRRGPLRRQLPQLLARHEHHDSVLPAHVVGDVVIMHSELRHVAYLLCVCVLGLGLLDGLVLRVGLLLASLRQLNFELVDRVTEENIHAVAGADLALLFIVGEEDLQFALVGNRLRGGFLLPALGLLVGERKAVAHLHPLLESAGHQCDSHRLVPLRVNGGLLPIRPEDGVVRASRFRPSPSPFVGVLLRVCRFLHRHCLVAHVANAKWIATLTAPDVGVPQALGLDDFQRKLAGVTHLLRFRTLFQALA
mmetsp:Transcript_53408/g.148508  ORF Transcript_53408/g.148508 Transcript_53408/m.148508 type:complete len:282 (+) Transcript_53408:1512-2357(+)